MAVVQIISASTIESYDNTGIVRFARNKDGVTYWNDHSGGKKPYNSTAVSFANLNYHIIDTLTGSENTLGNLNHTLHASSSLVNFDCIDHVDNPEYIFNALMLSRNGPYQYSSWQQIRNSDNKIVKYFRNNNVYSVVDEPRDDIVVVNNNGRTIVQPIRGKSITNFTEPMISSKYRPLTHILLVNDGKNEGMMELKHAYANNLVTFANPELVNRIGSKIEESQIYDKILELYTDEKGAPHNQIKDFELINYNETIYPKERNTYLKRTRRRTDYYVPSFWNDARADRVRYNDTNSQGYTVSTASIWPLDARTDFATANVTTGGIDGSGELQNSYMTYFSASVDDNEQPGLFGNSNLSALAINLRLSDNYKPDGVNSVKGYGLLYTSSNSDPVADEMLDCAYIGEVGTWDAQFGASQGSGPVYSFSMSGWIWVAPSIMVGGDVPDYQSIMELGYGNKDIRLAKVVGDVTARDLYMRVSTSIIPSSPIYNEYYTTDNPISVEQWHHIVVSYTLNGPVSFYVDGQQHTTTTVANGSEFTEIKVSGIGGISDFANNCMMFSSSFGSYPFLGYVNNFSMFRKVLTLAEIQEIYNNGKPKSLYLHSAKYNLLSWWPFGGGQGIYNESLDYTNYAPPVGPTITSLIDVYGSASIQKDSVFTDLKDKSNDYSDNSVDGGVKNILFDMIGNRFPANFAHEYVVAPAQQRSSWIESYNTTSSYQILSGSENHELSGTSDVTRTSGFLSNLKVGALFCHPEQEYTTSKWRTIEVGEVHSSDEYILVRVTGSKIYSNNSFWSSSLQYTKEPFYEDFTQYRIDVENTAKEYTVIPEFTISDSMPYYIDDKKGDFLQENTASFKVFGDISSSAENQFYEIYSHTDFLKYFNIIKEDHEDIGKLDKLKLECNAFVKFIPEKGFYPVQRTLELATLFSQSYGEYVKAGTYNDTANYDTAKWRAFFTPLFAPGILYNSIKSGVAVGFPVYYNAPSTKEDFRASRWKKDFFYWNSLTTQIDFADNDIGGIFNKVDKNLETAFYGYHYNAEYNRRYSTNAGEALSIDTADTSEYTTLGVTPLVEDAAIEWRTVLNSEFGDNLSFEALIEPEKYLSGKYIWDMEPEHSASVRKNFLDKDTNQSAYWGGEGSIKYKLAMHNFLAEVPNFFLKDGEFTSFQSEPITPEGVLIKEQDADSYYGMDVIMYNSGCKNLTSFYERKKLKEFEEIVANDYEITEEEMNNFKNIHTSMYDRDSAFGPPWTFPNGIITSSDDPRLALHYGREPYTPAYFNGFGLARILFYPYKGAGTYTLDEIQSNSKVNYIRLPENRTGSYGIYNSEKVLELLTINGLDENLLINQGTRSVEHISEPANAVVSSSKNWQMLDSSVNLFGKTKTKKVSYTKGTIQEYEPTIVEDDKINVDSLWSIQTKWETPIFNFADSSPTSPIYGTGSLSKGIWHQMGQLPGDEEGIFFEIADVPNKKLSSTFCSEETTNDREVGLRGSRCTWFDRGENLYEEKHKNAEVVIYIKAFGSLTGKRINFDLSKVQNNFNGDYRSIFTEGAQWDAATSNLDTAISIANGINTDDRDPGESSLQAHDWLTASAYIPLTTPWDNTIKDTAITDPIAAVKIKIVDKPVIDDYVVAIISGFTERLSWYPNYVATGEFGNSVTASLCNNIPAAWLIEGSDFATNEKTYSDSVYFCGGESKTYEIKSLSDLVGFSKTKQKLGQIEDNKKVYEAIVAIPYQEIGKKKKFFTIPKRQIELVLGEKKLGQNESPPGDSVIEMVEKMKRYVLPPKMDFITNRKIQPFAMYIFEFETKLSRDDLANIWQNLPPRPATNYFEKKTATIEHKLFGKEILNENFGEKVKWMVFKVKYKAEKNYFAKTADSEDDSRFKFELQTAGTKSKKTFIPDYSYNWPYDFFSIVQLAKIDASVDIKKKK